MALSTVATHARRAKLILVVRPAIRELLSTLLHRRESQELSGRVYASPTDIGAVDVVVERN